MSFFEDASLVYIPSAVKSGKTYSVKPTDGTGDLTFTRSNDTATRVGPDGLIEKVRTNLQTYSQNFTSAGGWGGDPVTATANYGTAPDGTQTSTRLVFSSVNHVWQKSITGINGNIGIFSLYIKGTAGQTIQIAYGGTDKLVTIGTGWTRVNTNGTLASTGTININTYGGNARDIEVWGGQTELGDIATDYIPTTSAAVSVGPVANVPRLDYLNSSCPRLLLEPQRTNLVTYSEQLDNAAWNKNANASVTANTSVSPDGYTNADSVVYDGTAFGRVEQIIAGLSGTYTFSVYVKVSSGTQSFTIGNGAAEATHTATTTWQRFSLSDVPIGSTCYPRVICNSANTLQVWGAQLEAGAYATSYIPTLGAAVTRGADACSKTGISSLIGQTEGTLFLEMNINKRVNLSGTGPNGLEIKDASGNNVIIIGTAYGSNQGFSVARRNAGSFSTLILTTNNALGTYKLAGAYSSAGFVFYVNGVQIGTSATLPPSATFADIGLMQVFGANNAEGELVNQALLFPTRLTNAQLAELTTL